MKPKAVAGEGREGGPPGFAAAARIPPPPREPPSDAAAVEEIVGDSVGFERQRLPAGLSQTMKRVKLHRDAEKSGGQAGPRGMRRSAGPRAAGRPLA